MELINDFEVNTGVEEAWRVLTDVERIAPCMPGAELREIEGDEYRGVVKVRVGPITAEYKGVARFLELDAEAHRAVLRAEGREARGQGNAAATITAQLEPTGNGTKVSVVTDLSITGKVAQFGRGVLADVSNKLLGQFVDNLEATVIERSDEASGAAEPADEVTEEAPAKAAKGSRRAAGRASKAPADEAAEAGETEAVEAAVSTNGSSAPAAPSEEEGPEEAAGDDAAAAGGAPAEESEAREATVRRLEPRPAEPVDLFEVAGPSLARRLLPVLIGGAILALVIAVIRRRSA